MVEEEGTAVHVFHFEDVSKSTAVSLLMVMVMTV